MSVDGGHQELPTVSTGRTLSAPPSDADSAATSNYALITGDSNNVQTPSHHTTMITHDQNGIHSTFSFSQQPTTSATRVKIDVGNYQQHPSSAAPDDVCVPPYLQNGRVEGFLLKKYCCSLLVSSTSSMYRYHRFEDLFPTWSHAPPPTKPATRTRITSDIFHRRRVMERVQSCFLKGFEGG